VSNLSRVHLLLLTARHNPVYTVFTCQSGNMLHSHLILMSCASLIHTLSEVCAEALRVAFCGVLVLSCDLSSVLSAPDEQCHVQLQQALSSSCMLMHSTKHLAPVCSCQQQPFMTLPQHQSSSATPPLSPRYSSSASPRGQT